MNLQTKHPEHTSYSGCFASDAMMSTEHLYLNEVQKLAWSTVQSFPHALDRQVFGGMKAYLFSSPKKAFSIH